MDRHIVEKIGGTSMSQFEVIMTNILLRGKRSNRIFVVSAYEEVTNLLLEHKQNGKDGIYQMFAKRNKNWIKAFEELLIYLKKLNKNFEKLGLNLAQADSFIEERIQGTKECLKHVEKLCAYGHFYLEDYLPAIREMLSSIGEAHSAYNTVKILKAQGIDVILADLTGWKDIITLPLEQKIAETFNNIDLAKSLTVATGYAQCQEGLMETFDRGYSEIIFSKIACITGASEGIIHKEFHLSTGDPNIIGQNKVKVVGCTNFDIADQLADLGMEAIHPKASKDMETKNISIRVKNAFEPDHQGTLISREFISTEPRVEIITGRQDLLAIELWDSDMVGKSGYDKELTTCLSNHNISYIFKNTNANTITHYIVENTKNIEFCLSEIKGTFPSAKISTSLVAAVCAIGSNMSFPGLLAQASTVLANEKINILAFEQCMRQVNMQFIISRDDFKRAVCILHKYLVEDNLLF